MTPGDRGSGRGRGPGLALVLAAAVSALVVVALGVVAILLVRDSWGGGGSDDRAASPSSVSPTSGSPASETTAATVVDGPPGVLEECSDSGEAVLPRSGRGTDVTSCAFAIAVREAYFRTARPGDPAMVEAVSPATGQSYEMGCIENQSGTHSDGSSIICRGGDNAVVHLY